MKVLTSNIQMKKGTLYSKCLLCVSLLLLPDALAPFPAVFLLCLLIPKSGASDLRLRLQGRALTVEVNYFHLYVYLILDFAAAVRQHYFRRVRTIPLGLIDVYWA